MKHVALGMLTFLFLGRSMAQQATSSGTEFWLNYMENLDLGLNGIPYMYITASSHTNAQVTLQVPATGDSFNYNVGAGHTTAIFVPSNFLYPLGAEAYYADGLHIVSTAPIEVHAYHHRIYFSDATMVLPVTELGTVYMIAAHLDDDEQYPSQFTILATQPATEVEIIPSVTTISLRPAHEPFTIDLDAGEVFQLQAYGDLSGSIVRSLDPAKAVAVFSGSKIGKVNCNITTDHLWTELMPVSSWGTEFAVVPYISRGGDIFKITALHDNTTVTTTTGVTLTLDSAEHVDQFIGVPALITASGPVAVVQFNEGQGCNGGAVGDPCMAFVPPSDHLMARSLFRAISGPGGSSMGWISEHTLNIATYASEGVGSFVLDGAEIGGLFQPIASAPGWYFARTTIDEGEHELVGAHSFQAQTAGFGDYNSYAYFTGYRAEDISTSVPSAAVPVVDLVVTEGLARVVLPAATMGGELDVFDMEGRSVRTVRVSGSLLALELGDLVPGGYAYRALDRGHGVVQHGRLLIIP